MTMTTPSEFSGRMAFAMISSVFVIAAGYGILLPILPSMIANLSNSSADVARHTGFVLALYLLSLSIFAPIWGRISDRIGRRPVLLIGLAGLGASELILSTPSSLASLYGERFLSGMFAAGIVPVALAVMGETAATEQRRARRISWISMASVAGFLLGPMVGSVIVGLFAEKSEAGFTLPFLTIAGLSLFTALCVYLFVPHRNDKGRVTPVLADSVHADKRILMLLLGLSFLGTSALGVFEVGLTLRGQQALGMTPFQIALVFAECSLAMFLAQALVFSRLLHADATRWLIGPAVLVMAVGISAIPSTSNFSLLLVWVGLVAVGAGILLPTLTYWVSRQAAENQGADLGKLTAATNLGQAVGSGVGGALFSVSVIPSASFVLTAVVLTLGAVVGAGLSRALGRWAFAERRAMPPAIVS